MVITLDGQPLPTTGFGPTVVTLEQNSAFDFLVAGVWIGNGPGNSHNIVDGQIFPDASWTTSTACPSLVFLIVWESTMRLARFPIGIDFPVVKSC